VDIASQQMSAMVTLQADPIVHLSAPPTSADRRWASHEPAGRSESGSLASTSPGQWRNVSTLPDIDHLAGGNNSGRAQHGRLSAGAASLHAQMGAAPPAPHGQASGYINSLRGRNGESHYGSAPPSSVPARSYAQGAADFSHPAVQLAIRQAARAVHEVQSNMAHVSQRRP
jgi:hypothetical protein